MPKKQSTVSSKDFYIDAQGNIRVTEAATKSEAQATPKAAAQPSSTLRINL
jgi:hypothetical protein